MSVGIRALAVALPRTVRTNEYWRARHPDVVRAVEEKTLARLFSTSQATAPGSSDTFDSAMARYLSDPFRGAVERRVMRAGETTLSLEVRAARDALRAAALGPEDIDLAIVCSFLPDQIGVGNAAFFARELGLACPAWNLESACSSALVALETAAALVESGRYRRVLVALSCSYSREADPTDTLSWFMGDAAGAFVVGPETGGAGLLAQKTVGTTATCDTFFYDLGPRTGRPRIQCSKETQRILRETSERFVRECCEGALAQAGVSRDDIACFVFNTPTAWFAEFAARSIGADVGRAIDVYARYANIGPALMPVNLHHAASTGRLRPGELALVYTIGSVSTASAAVMRWGEVALGPSVDPPDAIDGMMELSMREGE